MLNKQESTCKQKIIHTLVFFVGHLPLALRQLMGTLMGKVASLIPSKERRIILLQTHRFLPKNSPKPTPAQVYGNIGRVALESFNLVPFLADAALSPVCSDLDIVDDCKLTGAVALTAHCGNWDLLAAYMADKGVRINAIARETRNSVLQNEIELIRNSYGINSLWRNESSSVKPIIQCLKNKEVVAALIDQDTRVSSLHSSFFGTKAKTPSGLVAIAKRMNVPIVSAFSYLNSEGRYQIEVKRFADGMDIQQVLDEYHQRLELIVLKHPEQWVWFHKRWRTNLEGKTLGSKQYMEFLSKHS